MAQPVGNLAIVLSANSAPLMRGLDQARTQIQNFGTLNVIKESAGGGGGLLAGLIGGAGAGAVLAAVGAASSAVGALRDGVASAAAAVGGLGVKAVGLAAAFQDSRTAYRTLTGSAADGDKLLNQIQELAAATPFQSKDLTAAGQGLLGRGVTKDNLIPVLSTLGEINAAAGGGAAEFKLLAKAFSDTTANGRLMTEEINQFANVGVTMADFAQTSGKGMLEFRQALEQGRVGVDVMVGTLNRLTTGSGRFAGGLVAASGNWNAIVNNLTENLELGLKDVGLKLIDGLNSSGVMDQFGRFVSWFRANAPAVGTAIGDAFTRAKPLVDAFAAGLRTVAGGFATLGEQAGPAGFIGLSEQSFKRLATDGVGAFVTSLGAMADVSVKTGGILATQLFVPLLKFLQRANDLSAQVFEASAAAARAGGFKSQAADFAMTAKGLRASDPLFDVAIVDARALGRLAKSANFAEQFSQSFAANLAKGATAAQAAANALDKVGQITPPNALAPDVAARAMELRKGLENADPLDNFDRAKGLTLAAGIRRGPDGSRLSREAVNFGLVDAFRDLEKALGDASGKIPNAVAQGTVEAQRAINAAMTQSDKNNLQVRVLETLKRAEQYQRDTRDATKKLADELLRSRVLGKGI